MFKLLTSLIKKPIWYSILAITYIGEFILFPFKLILPDTVFDMLYIYSITPDLHIIKTHNNEQSDFDKVIEFNRLFNVPQIDNGNTGEKNLNIIKNGFALITEEIEELKDALNNGDRIEVKDAICDMIYVIYGLYWRLGMTDNKIIYNMLKKLNNAYGSNKIQPYYCNHNIYTIFNGAIKSYMDIYINNHVNYNKYIINSGIQSSIESDNEENVNKYDVFDLHRKVAKDDLFEFYERINVINSINNMKNNVQIVIDAMTQYKTYYNNVSYFQTCLNMVLASILNYTYYIGLMHFDIKRDFNIVHKSNMSKVCSSEDEAVATVESYKSKFETGEVSYDSPYYEFIENGKWMVRNRSTNKVLKNINYLPVEAFDEWLDD